MKRTRLLLTGTLISILLLPGCSSPASTSNHDMDNMQGMKMTDQLTIDFTTNPATVHKGTEAQLIEHVKQAGKDLPDASVVMEIWNDNNPQHEKIKATPDNKGNYIVKKVFDQSGTYHVTLHTTTDDLHQMPTKEFQVNP
jgi:hypothetical protein